MIRSMTAYAKAEKIDGEKKLSVECEIRTYNHRHLDMSLRVPHGYGSVEEKIKSVISERLTRGRVEMKLYVRDESEEKLAYEVDEKKAAALGHALETLKKTLGISGELPIELFAGGSSGIIKQAEVPIDLEEHWALIRECLDESLSSLIDMRTREGAFLKKDFNKRIDYIEDRVGYIREQSDDLAATLKERLVERIEKLTEGTIALDEGRVAQEAAFLADKSDISEEIVRAECHIEQFRAIMAADEPSGRKLNFLLQEFNREFNTMGSKIGNAGLAHVVVDLKSELEKLREQVQNIE